MKKKLLSLLLVICMVIGMLPVIAMAEVTNQDDFYLEYWNGESGKSHWTGISVAPGETEYLVQTEVDSDGYSYLITDGASADNYVIKVVYPAGEAPTVYFNGLDIVQPGSYGILFERDGTDGNGWTSNSDMNLVIEADSSITIDGEGTYGAIEFYCTATTTISSVNGAVLTAYGEDCTEGDATIWTRGDLVIDGAVLDIEADEGYAIGAAGTITIVDSDVTAVSEKATAFNKAPAIDAELGAIAGTARFNADEDLVEFVAEDVGTYKYVKIGADVALPEIGGGEEGGDDEEVVLETFYLEYWNGADGWAGTSVAQGETKYLAQTAPDEATDYSYLIPTEDTENYVIKIVYPVGEAPTVYFNGLNMVNPAPRAILFERDGTDGNGWETRMDMNLVIEKDSFYTVDAESNYGGFEIYTTGTFTISSTVDPKTGKPAVLHMYAEDNRYGVGLSYAATIYARGDLVMDGAALDITADEGNAIGAAGTITIVDSEVTAWSEKFAAYNKAPVIDEELGAIAATTHVPNDPDLVEFDAAAVDTYKFVKVGPNVELPAAFGSGDAWFVPVLNAGEAKYYLATEIGDLTEEGASAENYDVALVYDENGATIYLDGVNLKNPSPINYSGTAPLTIVVEADSSLYAAGNAYPAIVAPVDTVIKSEGKAVLTVTADGPADSFASTGNGGQVDGAIRVVGDLTLENANLNVEFPENCAKHSGIVVDGGNLIVDGGNLNIGKGYTATINNLLQLMCDANDENGGMEIKNGADVVLMTEANGRPIRYDGEITISDSNFEAGSTDITNGRRIFRDTLPTITGDFTIVGSTAAPTLDTVNFAMTAPADTAEIDPATLIATKYYYVKISVEKPAAEVVTEAWEIPELAAGEAKYYVIDSEGALTEAGASAENYKVAYIYEENGPTIYLNGVTMENEAPINYNGTAPLTIVVEADSSLYAVGNTYPAIVAPVDTVIKSEGEAVLTVTADGPANSFVSTGNGGQVDGAIRVVGDLTLEKANLNIEFPENCAKHSGIVVDGGNLIVDGGNLNIGKGYTATANSLLQLMCDANKENGGMEIKNGANVVLMTDANGRPIRYDGAITISDSNFEAGSTNVDGGRRIFRDILPTITGDVTIVGSTAAPTLDTVNFAMTAPADTAEVDAATLIDTKYYYVKITVNEEAPEEPDVPVEPEVPEYTLGVSVTFGESLDMNFYLPIAAVDANTTWTVMIDGVEVTEDKYTIEPTTHKQLGECYRVRATFNANQMYKVMSVTARNGEGKLLAQRSMSIREYAMLVLNTAGFQEKMYALMVATLDYGALAQQNKAGNTAPLVNKDLTAEHRAHLDNFAWPTRTGDLASASQENTTTKFGVSVTFSECLDMNFYLPIAAVDANTTWTVEIDGVEVSEDKYTIERTTHNQLGECYRVRATFYANQMYKLMSVTARNGEGELIAQRSMSICEYAMLVLKTAGFKTDMYALMVATLDYGALAQVNKTGDTSPLVNKGVTATQREYLPHTHNYSSNVTAPTCTEKGYTTYTCSCGHTYTANQTAAKGHSYSEATCTKAATCACGAVNGTPLGHFYNYGICSRCDAADPNYNEPAPGEPGFVWKIATTTGDLVGYGDYDTDADAIRGLYDAGFRYIDFSMYSNLTSDSVYMSKNWREEVLKLKAVADELGMTFVQAHSPGGNLLTTNQSEANELIAATKRSIEICEVLGIRNLVVHIGWRDGINRQEWMRLNKEMYNNFLPLAEKCGVNILCENSTVKNMRDFHYLSTGAEMREFVEYVDHPNFHACWDTGHANCDNLDQYQNIVDLGDELYAIHYAENDGNYDSHVMPFFGTVNHNDIMRALVEIGFRGPFVLECDGGSRTSNTYTGPAFDWIKEELNVTDPTNPSVLGRLNRAQQEKLLFDIANYIVTTYPTTAP